MCIHVAISEYTCITHFIKLCVILYSYAVAVGGQPHKSEPSPQPSSTAPPSSPISSQGQATKPAPQAQPQVSSTTGATPAGDHDSLLVTSRELLVTCVT